MAASPRARRSFAMRHRRGSPDAAAIERMVSAPARHHLQQSYQHLTGNLDIQPHTLPHNPPPHRPANARRSSVQPASAAKNAKKKARLDRRRLSWARLQSILGKRTATAIDTSIAILRIFPPIFLLPSGSADGRLGGLLRAVRRRRKGHAAAEESRAAKRSAGIGRPADKRI
jgi:hypothetical protein